MKKVIILVGAIASGKSTLARRYAKEQGAVIVSDDAIVTAVHGGDYTLYDAKLKPLYKGVEESIFRAGLTVSDTVVVDRGVGNHTAAGRQRWIALARAVDVEVIAVVTPREESGVHAYRRWLSDSRDLSLPKWIEIAERHEAEYNAPSLAEGLSAIYSPTWEQIVGGALPGTPRVFKKGDWVTWWGDTMLWLLEEQDTGDGDGWGLVRARGDGTLVRCGRVSESELTHP